MPIIAQYDNAGEEISQTPGPAGPPGPPGPAGPPILASGETILVAGTSGPIAVPAGLPASVYSVGAITASVNAGELYYQPAVAGFTISSENALDDRRVRWALLVP